tara:strand:- start:51176 stop:51643 length:468 start_codon:yes stop_codon:yes gene_type:complete
MPTPLEIYLSKYPPGFIPTSTIIAIIGSDNDHKGGDLLLPLYKEFEAKVPSVNPNCLAAYLINNKLPWKEENNRAWMQLCVNSPTLDTFLVAHIKINTALKAASVDGKITEVDFIKHYTGNKNSSYAEIIMLLSSGYTNYSEVDYDEITYGRLYR